MFFVGSNFGVSQRLKDWRTPGPIISPVSVLSALETTISYQNLIIFPSESHHIPMKFPMKASSPGQADRNNPLFVAHF